MATQGVTDQPGHMAAADKGESLTIPQRRLDYLRGIAALYVVLNHTRGAFWIGGEALLSQDRSFWNYVSVAALQITSLGEEAVILFFVLSGFAMAHSVRLSSSISRFYAKRIIRIWPPYIAATLFAMFIGLGIGDLSVSSRLWQIIFYDNPGDSSLTPQFWSLPYEVIFYLLCPLILASVRHVRVIFVVGIIAALLTLAVKGPALNPYNNIFVNFLSCELLIFACGALAYYYYDAIPSIRQSKRLAVVMLAGLSLVWVIRHGFGLSNIGSNVVMISLSVLLIKNLPNFTRYNIGRFSYSIYLFHYALIVIIVSLLAKIGIIGSQITNPVAWTLAVPPILLTSYGLYLVTERISNRGVDRLRRSPEEGGRGSQG